MRRRALRLAAGVLVLALAASAALAAEDARRWPQRIERGDHVFSVSTLGVVDPWKPADRLPLRVGDELVGVGDDVALRRALHLVRRVRAQSDIELHDASWIRLVADAQSALVAIESSDPDPRRQSWAANLLGFLYFEAGQVTRAQAREELTEAALNAYRRAVVLDAQNDEAKYNLELLMTRLVAQGAPVPEARLGRQGERGESGAGLIPPGSGY